MSTMESDESNWLKKRFRETPTDGPLAKKVKFDDIQAEVSSHFSKGNLSTKTICDAIKEAFPCSVNRRCGKNRVTHICGVEQIPSEQDIGAKDREIEELRERVKMLEERIQHMEQEQAPQALMSSQLLRQMDNLVSPSNSVYHGPNCVKHFHEFSMDGLIAEFNTHAPEVFELLKTLGHATLSPTDQLKEAKVVTSMCSLAKCCSMKVLGLQLMISFMLLARSTNHQAITTLSHAGVCVSYLTAWKYLRELTTESRYQDTVRRGHWQWVYDNVNLHQKVRHEREDRHSSMLNITSHLAVRIRNLPDWTIDWSDTTPQRSRESVMVDDFLPSEEDAEERRKSATDYVMRFLVCEFESLSDLKKFAPEQKPIHTPQKSEVVPMTVLFKDEKYTSETIDILSQLTTDATLSGDPQVVVDDQLTCKNIRSSKLWRQVETNPKERLAWVNEMPGDFHFLWECLRVFCMIFWGSPAQVGSLCNLREIIRHTQVDKTVKVFNIGDEFLIHAFKGHLIASIMTHLKITKPTDQIEHPSTQKWLQETATELVCQNHQLTLYIN